MAFWNAVLVAQTYVFVTSAPRAAVFLLSAELAVLNAVLFVPLTSMFHSPPADLTKAIGPGVEANSLERRAGAR